MKKKPEEEASTGPDGRRGPKVSEGRDDLKMMISATWSSQGRTAEVAEKESERARKREKERERERERESSEERGGKEIDEGDAATTPVLPRAKITWKACFKLSRPRSLEIYAARARARAPPASTKSFLNLIEQQTVRKIRINCATLR